MRVCRQEKREKDRTGSEMKKVGCVASKIAVLCGCGAVGTMVGRRWEQEDNYKQQRQQEQKLID